MAHQPKPFFRTGRGWYVQLSARQIKLCDGPKSAETEKTAWAEFYKLMAAPVVPHNSASSATRTVAEVFEKFLDWCQAHRAARTYELSKKHIQSFCDHLTTAATLPATELRPFHLVEWADSKTAWGPNERRNGIVDVTRAFNWAEKLGYIATSPIRGVEKPGRTKRESRMTPADFNTLLAHVGDEPFRDLLTFVYEAGCRPQEARLIEARHLKTEHKRVEIPPAEAKGKKRWRVIYLSDRAFEIAARLAELRPSGPLFLNVDGNPWKAQAVVCRFQRLLVKLSGVEEKLPKLPRFNYRKYPDPAQRVAAKAEHQKTLAELRKRRAALAREGDNRFAMYDIRHLYATRKLKEGHDPITVSALLGHRDATMLCKHYESLSTDGEHLRSAANGPR